jgi:hypothetical protein
MKLGQTNYSPNDTTGPHYGLQVRQLGPRYYLNYGVYSEVAGDYGYYGGETVDGITGVRGIGVYGSALASSDSQQKGIGVYGKATNTAYNYNSTIGVRGRAEAGTTSFLNNYSYKSYGGHFVATGKAHVVGVYADAYLDGSPGTSQEAIPLLVASNGSELMRVSAAGTATFAGAIKADAGIDFSGAQTNAAGMTSETLDAYEEGTFTPDISYASGSGWTLTEAVGTYIKIGNQVRCICLLTWDEGSGSGGVKITGLPFNIKNDSKVRLSGYCIYLGGMSGLSSNIILYNTQSQSSAIMYYVDTGYNLTAVTDTNTSSGQTTRFVMTYPT